MYTEEEFSSQGKCDNVILYYPIILVHWCQTCMCLLVSDFLDVILSLTFYRIFVSRLLHSYQNEKYSSGDNSGDALFRITVHLAKLSGKKPVPSTFKIRSSVDFFQLNDRNNILSK